MKTFKWTVEFSVDETWVADGFVLNAETAKDMLQTVLPYAYEHEFGAKIFSKPSEVSIAKAQGYAS